MRRVSELILCAASLYISSASVVSSAATVTDLAETPNSLNFSFSGTGLFDFVINFLPPLTFWDLGHEDHGQFGSGLYAFFFVDVQHLHDGPLALVGGYPKLTSYGSNQFTIESFAHGTSLDTYTLSVTVYDNGRDEWGDFSGWFSATHATPKVGEASSTGFLLGLAGLGIVATQLLSKSTP